jgi:hypothetical protein
MYIDRSLKQQGIDLLGQIDGLGFEVETYLVTQCRAGLGVGNEGHQSGENDPEHQDMRLDLRDLSLFATWKPVVRWLLFAEAEVEDAFSIDDRGLNASDAELTLERFYLDYIHRSWLSWRAGKFLTPVGRWNNVHADPLVWTVTRPLVTELPFASHATGLAARGTRQSDASTLDYIVYVDDSEDFDPANGETDFEGINLPGQSNDFNQAAGLQLRYYLLDDQVEIAASYAHFTMHDQPGDKQLAGLDFYWSVRGYELSSELVYRFNEGPQSNEWGGVPTGRDAAGRRSESVRPL